MPNANLVDGFLQIRVDDDSPLFIRAGMLHKDFPSDFRQIRYFTLRIVQMAPPEIRQINLLEQQISEVIKNAVKHGNRSRPEKLVKVWYGFSVEHAHLIVEDEGSGFQDLGKWNEFNRRRQVALDSQDWEALSTLVSFRSLTADENDGGNALFAALEFWDGGFIFSGRKNSVGMLKRFPRHRHLVR
ncbi:MAG: ATP-binding protein [Spirochaetota bacterium]